MNERYLLRSMRTDNDDEIFYEPDLLTNFPDYQLSQYKKAIEEFGDDTLWISDKAFDCLGRKLKNCYSLRSKEPKNRSDFWALFHSLTTTTPSC